MTCEGRKDQMLLYLADGLEPAERDTLEAHLETGCPRCAADLAEARAVIGHLPLVLSPKSPDPSVKDRLFARIRSTPPVIHDAVVAGRVAPGDAEQGSSGRGGLGRSRFWTVATPGLAAVLAASITYGIMSVEFRDYRERMFALAEEVDGLAYELRNSTEEVADIRTFKRAAQNLMNAFSSQAMQVIDLAGAESRTDVWGRMFWDPSRNICYVFAPELSAPDEEHEYSLWLVAEGREDPIRAGGFRFAPTGYYEVQIDLPEDTGRVTDISIRVDGDEDDDVGPEILHGRLR